MEVLRQVINEELNQNLEASITVKEVKEAAFSMHQDKSPGPDDLNPAFYQTFWDVVGPDVVSVCEKFWHTRALSEGLNATYIVLIPKKDAPHTMGDFRPISLCNVLYKIITKVLANRLKKVLNLVVLGSQSAFIPRRFITNNMLIAYEVTHFIKRKT